MSLGRPPPTSNSTSSARQFSSRNASAPAPTWDDQPSPSRDPRPPARPRPASARPASARTAIHPVRPASARPASARPASAASSRTSAVGAIPASAVASGRKRTSRGGAVWRAASQERHELEQTTQGDGSSSEAVETARMEFEARPMDDGLGSTLLAVRPKSVSVRREDLLCRRAFHASDGATALESLDEAIRLNPRHFKAIFNRAVVKLQADDADAALRDLERAMQLAGRDPRCLYNRAVALRERGDYAAAIDDLDEAINSLPTRVAAFFSSRALAHRKRGAWHASIRDYATARQLVDAGAPASGRRTSPALSSSSSLPAPSAAAAGAPAGVPAVAEPAEPAEPAERGAERAALVEAARTPAGARSAAQLALLSELLGRMSAHGGGLGALPAETRLELCRALGYVEAPPGTAVVREGETGHSFYVVLFGTLQVSQRRAAGGEGVGVERTVNVARLGAGEHFGELALLRESGARRAATVRALLPCGLLCIEEADYRRTVRDVQLRAMEERVAFVRSVGMFAALPADKLLKLATVLRPLAFERGAVVMRQGGSAQGLYLVESGRLVVEREVAFDDEPGGTGRATRTLALGELTRRDVCGELALLQPKRKVGATVRALHPARCLFLARADFTPRLLPEETLRELRLGSRRHAADDGLRAQYYQDLEWQRAKRVYVKQVLSEARDRRAAERRKIGIW